MTRSEKNIEPEINIESEKNIEPKINSWAEVGNEDAVVFSILLSDKEDSNFNRLSGMIAYAQYSLHKHQFIQKYIKDESVPPTDDQVKTIIRSFQDENSYMLDNLSQQSKKLLTEIIEEYANQISEDKFVKPVEKIIKDNTKFSSSIKASIVASFIYSLIIASVIFTATAALPDTKFSKIIQILIEKNEDSQ